MPQLRIFGIVIQMFFNDTNITTYRISMFSILDICRPLQ